MTFSILQDNNKIKSTRSFYTSQQKMNLDHHPCRYINLQQQKNIPYSIQQQKIRSKNSACNKPGTKIKIILMRAKKTLTQINRLSTTNRNPEAK